MNTASLDERDLERVTAGKELRERAGVALGEWTAAARDVQATSANVDAKINRLSRQLDNLFSPSLPTPLSPQ